MTKRLIVSLPCLFVLLAPFAVQSFSKEMPSKRSSEDNRAITSKLSSLKIPFIANQGQADEGVRFYAKTFGGTVSLKKDGEIVYSMDAQGGKDGSPKEGKVVGFKEALVGARIKEIIGHDKSSAKVNYFIGNDKSRWKTDIQTYDTVTFGEIYNGIELRLKAHGNNVEKFFYVSPGAKAEDIKVAIKEVKGMRIDEQGKLEFQVGAETLGFSKPIAYQEIDGKIIDVEVAYAIFPPLAKGGVGGFDSALTYGFKVANYDTTKPLIIDPVLSYSTYLGSSGRDSGLAIAVDTARNAYVTGLTGGSEAGSWDAFVTKINTAGTAVIYSTYLAGSNSDAGYGIAVDTSGNAYVTGYTDSANFPTQNPIRAGNAGGRDVFVTKINAEGNALVYSTYLGGSATDYGLGIAVDTSGNAYITGFTESTNFPTQNSIQGTYAGDSDAFLTKINAEGNALVYSTYLGGSALDRGYGITVDTSGNAYITGSTASSNFPTQSSIQGTHAGGSDAFVTKINAEGNAFVYSTYLGGSATDYGLGIAVDTSGNAHVTGNTSSGGDSHSTDFPTRNPIQGTNAGGSDIIVTKINTAGTALFYSTYLGGSSLEYAHGIAVDTSGNAYIIGDTASTDFPTQNPIQRTKAVGQDVFVTKINAAGTAIVYSTYLGGGSPDPTGHGPGGPDYGYGIAVDTLGNAYATGETYSEDFPTHNPIQGINAGGGDVFVTKITSPFVSLVSPNQGTVGTEILITGSGFGKGGKVLLQDGSGSYALKVQQWNPGDNGEIRALLNKAMPSGTYDVVVVPKGADPITVTDAFTVKEAVITSVDPTQGAEEDTITINGMFFGTKVKVYLEDKATLKTKKCKGAGLFMDKTTGVSWAKFWVPEGLGDGAYNLVLINNLGEVPKVDFTVGP